MYNLTKDITMTSLWLAEVTGKQHAHIMRDIRNEIDSLGQNVGQSIFGCTSYTDKSNREKPCYTFGKKGAMQLALKYDANTRYKVIVKLEELERGQAPQIDSKFLYQLAQSLEAKEIEIKQLNTENDLLAKKQLEWTTRQTILAIIRKIGGKYDYQDAWRMFKAQLLYRHNIDINHRHTLAKKNAKNKSKVKTMDMFKVEELNDTLSTATALARSLKVDISSIIDNQKKYIGGKA